MHYGTPQMPGEVGVKVARHARGPAFDPECPARTPDTAEIDEAIAGASRYLPGLTGQVVQSRLCLYTNSPDGHFIIDRAPALDRVHVACGFSGHGFKFAPVIGEVMADLATSGRTTLPVEFLSLRRFARA
jgi:sarcosine oxidase